jgi:uncharacterized cupredoxin-like copper-binding protein
MPRRPALPLAALLSGIALLASACALPDLADRRAETADRVTQAVSSTRPPRVPPRRQAPARARPPTVKVVMNDQFRYRPDAMIVMAGRTVTFAVTNAGKLPHEFILGDQATQLDHERQMQAAAAGGGGTPHVHGHGGHGTSSGPTGALTVPPGQTRRLSWTFDEPGVVIYGCHILGHWAAGMKGTIVVIAPDGSLPSLSPRRP